MKRYKPRFTHFLTGVEVIGMITQAKAKPLTELMLFFETLALSEEDEKRKFELDVLSKKVYTITSNLHSPMVYTYANDLMLMVQGFCSVHKEYCKQHQVKEKTLNAIRQALLE